MKKKKVKNIFQEDEAAELRSISSDEAHPTSPHQGLVAATERIDFLVPLPTDQCPVYKVRTTTGPGVGRLKQSVRE